MGLMVKGFDGLFILPIVSRHLILDVGVASSKKIHPSPPLGAHSLVKEFGY